jgi:hypothetical protein
MIPHSDGPAPDTVQETKPSGSKKRRKRVFPGLNGVTSGSQQVDSIMEFGTTAATAADDCKPTSCTLSVANFPTAVDVKPSGFPSLTADVGAEIKSHALPSIEINNNCHGNNKAVIHSSDADGSAAAATGVRKSKRCNRGRRYNELVSQGILHPVRRQVSSSIDGKDDSDSHRTDDYSDMATDSQPEITEPVIANGPIRCKRFKSGEFDLDAQIASLPPCHLAMADRKAAARLRSRSHSSSQTSPRHNDTASDSFIQSKQKVDANQQWMNICDLRQLTRHQHSTASRAKGCCTVMPAGSCRRKPAKCSIVHLVCESSADTRQAARSLLSDGSRKAACRSPKTSGSHMLVVSSHVSTTLTTSSDTVDVLPPPAVSESPDDLFALAAVASLKQAACLE